MQSKIFGSEAARLSHLQLRVAQESGFYYLQSRYYDPSIGRFINADAAEYSKVSAIDIANTNLFAYCQNNPVLLIDSSGHSPIVVAGAIAGAVISGLSYVATHQSAVKPVGLIASVLSGAAIGGIAATGNFELAAKAALLFNYVINTVVEGQTPDVALMGAVCAGATAFIGGAFGTKLAGTLAAFGIFSSNLLGSLFGGGATETISQMTQNVTSYNPQIKAPQTSTNSQFSVPNTGYQPSQGLSSDFRGLDYWNKYYGDNWSHYYS